MLPDLVKSRFISKIVFEFERHKHMAISNSWNLLFEFNQYSLLVIFKDEDVSETNSAHSGPNSVTSGNDHYLAGLKCSRRETPARVTVTESPIILRRRFYHEINSYFIT